MSFKNRIDKKYRIPHMGWNIVNVSLLTNGFEEFDETRFYFVHSYFVKVENEKNSILKTSYGVEFDSAIQKDNIYGAQFHPENLVWNFLKILQGYKDVKNQSNTMFAFKKWKPCKNS